MTFSKTERSYLTGQLLGRLATVGTDGTPQVLPLGFRLNPDDTIDLEGTRLATTERYRNVLANPRVSFVVDDMAPNDLGATRPGMGRGIEIQGYAQLLAVDEPPVNPDELRNEFVRIHPYRILSWQIDADNPDGPPRHVTPSRFAFNYAYTSRTAAWVIGEPQPAIVALERDGWIHGTVLDVGCGTGEHTILLAKQGYDVRGIDVSSQAIEQAHANATEHKVAARFEVADVWNLGKGTSFHTIIDSGLFHIFDRADRARYVHSLHRACRPGALVHVLALSDDGPGFGPQVSGTAIREAFAEGWVLEQMQVSKYRGVIGGAQAAQVHRAAGEFIDLPAWLARLRRI
jgi:PPOX class F420-dependent enzyme/OxyR family protein